MQIRLGELLCCPMCRRSLGVEGFKYGTEVEEGVLRCTECTRIYPIIDGIPRLLPDSLAHLVPANHRAFFRRHSSVMAPFLARCGPSEQRRWRDVEKLAHASYSYQWRKFKEMFPHWEQLFVDSIRPIEPSFFSGRLGLDAGCGFGRSLYYAASYGAEVVGMDLSEAVESARENTRSLRSVHVVQADIYHPPLRDRSLDFVYSIGVLHLLPDPKRGFHSLARLLAPGAPLFIWVYRRGPRRRGFQITALRIMRRISARLPLVLLDAVCLGLAVGQWILWIAPYRVLGRFVPTRSLAGRLPFTLYARYPFRVLHADWFDGLSTPVVNYYTRDEIMVWFREAELEGVHIDQEFDGRAVGYSPS